MATMAGKQGRAKRARRQFTDEFKAGAVRLVLDEGKTVAQVARDLDLTASALGGWVNASQRPTESAKRFYFLSFVFAQDVGHSRRRTMGPASASTSRRAAFSGRFSDDHQWPVLGDHRGRKV